MTARYGFMDKIDVPATLRLAAEDLEGELDLERASYFLSRISIVRTDAPGMARWRKRLFVVIARNAANPVTLFGLPDDQTVVLSAHVESDALGHALQAAAAGSSSSTARPQSSWRVGAAVAQVLLEHVVEPRRPMSASHSQQPLEM